MKSYTIDPGVLLGSGGVPIQTYTATGVSVADLDTIVPITHPVDDGSADAAEPLPAFVSPASASAVPLPAGPAPMAVSGGTGEPPSQYSTQGPIPQ